MPERNDTQAIIDTAISSAEPFPVDEATDFYIMRDGSGYPQVIDLEAHREQYADHPRTIKGKPTVYTHESFREYVERHRTNEIEVWSDDSSGTVTAVFDSHTDVAGRGDHRLTLTLRQTFGWNVWAGQSGQMMPQATFAEFIEDNVENIVNPSSADMLELAQSFQAATDVQFESSKFLDSGHRQLVYKETVEAKAGKRGQLDIPNTFELALQPFVGLDTYRVRARFRYRIAEGDLRLGYKLDRPDDVLRTAFDDTVTKISDDLGLPILAGKSW